jgi:hypothetical protein
MARDPRRTPPAHHRCGADLLAAVRVNGVNGHGMGNGAGRIREWPGKGTERRTMRQGRITDGRCRARKFVWKLGRSGSYSYSYSYSMAAMRNSAGLKEQPVELVRASLDVVFH